MRYLLGSIAIVIMVLGLAQAPDVEAGGAHAVDVTLNEFEIVMPSSLPAGATRFEVTNAGKANHNITIEGPGVDGATLAEDLEPGESGALDVNLQPGTYEIWCPVGSHRKMGMETSFTVS